MALPMAITSVVGADMADLTLHYTLEKARLAVARGPGKPPTLTGEQSGAIQPAMRFQAILVPALAVLLAGCGGGTPLPRRTSALPTVRAPTIPPKVVRPAPPRANFRMIPGLESVIGATSADLTRQFGTPRLEDWEGDARKLQFTGNACVLDVYLYPSDKSGEPQAAYAEARRSSDGRDVDRAACVAALRKR